MKLWKLTDKNGQTRNGTQWGENVTNSGTGKGELCGPGYIHAYEHPLLAVLLNPIHADFPEPRLWEAEGEIAIRDGQLKCGCVTLTTIREVPMPDISITQRVAFGILCAKKVCTDTEFTKWADDWLSGKDRSKKTAWSKTATTAWAAARGAGLASRWTRAMAPDGVAGEIDLIAIAEEAMKVN